MDSGSGALLEAASAMSNATADSDDDSSAYNTASVVVPVLLFLTFVCVTLCRCCADDAHSSGRRVVGSTASHTPTLTFHVKGEKEEAKTGDPLIPL